MALESGTYISDLNPSNPVGATDKVSTLDDHVRLIKSTLQNTFPNIDGEVSATEDELNHLDGVTGTTGTGKLVLDDAPTIADLTVTGSITLPAASIADAALSSNVMLTGAYGLGSQNLGSSVDMDFVNTTQFDARFSSATGPGGEGWAYLTLARSPTRVAQIAVRTDTQDRTNGNLIAVRHSEDASNGLWYPWRFLWHTGNFDPNTKANASHTHSAADITSGTLSDARLPATIGGNKTFSNNVAVGGTLTVGTNTQIFVEPSLVAGSDTVIRNTQGTTWYEIRGLDGNSGNGGLLVRASANSGGDWTDVLRATPARIQLDANDIDINGPVDISGTLAVGGARIAGEGGVIYHDSTNNLGGKIVLSSSPAATAEQVGAPGDMRFVYS